MNAPIDYAIDYALLRGWPVFPCKPANKQPLTEHGVKDASTDPDVIRAWWRASKLLRRWRVAPVFGWMTMAAASRVSLQAWTNAAFCWCARKPACGACFQEE